MWQAILRRDLVGSSSPTVAPAERLVVARSSVSAVSVVWRFERMIVPVSGHYLSLEQLHWLRRIVREELRMLEAGVCRCCCDFRSGLCFSAVENAEAG